MIDRIKKIIDKEGSNPSLFADAIGISRSSMNHILNGRNNPSLDVLVKILTKFDYINSDWLLFGKPPMYKGEKAFLQPSLFDENPIKQEQEPKETEYRSNFELNTPPVKIQNPILENFMPNKTSDKKIAKLMIFYSDNTFESFTLEIDTK